MADTMNFGPEWLRTLSSQGGGSNAGPPSPTKPLQTPVTVPTANLVKKFKLAEFRYGKEELLQLFMESAELPTDMPPFPPISNVPSSSPLAFLPLSDEEQVAMSGGVNSGTVYNMRGGRGYYPSRGGGRGGGRGRGRGDYHRSSSYSEDYPPPERAGYGGYYGNRGGTAGTPASTPGDGRPLEGGTSTRGGYTPTSGGPRNGSRANRDDNWRNPTPSEEDVSGPTAWSNHWPPTSPGKAPPPGKVWQHPASKDPAPSSAKLPSKWHALPEWASDDVGPGVGSFDSSGKFTASGKFTPSGDPDDDDKLAGAPDHSKSHPPNQLILGQPPSRSQHRATEQAPPPPPGHAQSKFDATRDNRAEKNTRQTSPLDQTGSNSVHPDAATSQDGGSAQIHISARTTSTPLAAPSHADPTTTTGPSAVSTASVFPTQQQSMADSSNSLYRAQQGFSSGMGGQGVVGARSEGGGLMLGAHNPSASAAVTTTPSSAVNIPVSHDQDDSVFSPSSVDDERMKLIEQAAEALLSTEEEDTPTQSSLLPSKQQQVLGTATQSTGPTLQQQTTPILDHSPQPLTPQDMAKWYYKDPQGEIQGPFSSNDMKKWYEAGYFTMDLMMRRACDMIFLPLGQVINIWGRVPFNAGGKVPPPIAPNNPFWQQMFQQQQFAFQQQQLLVIQQQLQSTMVTTAATSQQQQQVLKVRSQQQSRPVTTGQVHQPQLPSTTRATDSIWGTTKTQDSGGDQWPEIESVWDTLPPSTATQATPTDHAQKLVDDVASQNAAKLQEAEDRKREEEEAARRLAEAEHQRQVAVEEAKKHRELEVRMKLEAEARAKEEAERKKEMELEAERQRQAMAELKRRQKQREEDAQLLLQQQQQRKEELKAQEKERERQLLAERERQLLAERERQLLVERERQLLLAERERHLQVERERQLLAERERQLQVERQLQLERERQLQAERERQAHQQQAWMSAGGGDGTGGPGKQGTSILRIQQEEAMASEQRQRELQYQQQMRQQQQQQQQQLAQTVGWASISSGGAVQVKNVSVASGGSSKPKSFLEIQQEQESDIPLQPAPAVPKTLGAKIKASSWSSITKTKQSQQTPPSWTPISPAQNITSSSSTTTPQPHPQQQSRVRNLSYTTSENDDEEEKAFWDECDMVAKKNPAKIGSSSKGEGDGGGGKKRGTDKEERNLRRLLSSNDASSEFNSWCDQELHKFNTDVDTATFISFLLEVDSVYEVHDYVKSYLGEGKAAHDFAKQFLERRQKVKPASHQNKKSRARERSSSCNKNGGGEDPSKLDSDPGTEGAGGGAGGSKSNKKKKKKMQKVNPAAMLGFTVNAADRPNMGEIQTLHDNS